MKMKYSKTKLTMLIVVTMMVFGSPSYVTPTQSNTTLTSDLSVPDWALATLDQQKVDSYIVLMLDLPVINYDGSIDGLKATKVTPGSSLDSSNADVVTYASYLENSHNQVLASVGLDTSVKVNDYKYALNGFSAMMTQQQAQAISSLPGVISATVDQVRTIDHYGHGKSDSLTSTQDFLGLTDRGGAYAKGFNGEGIIIGDVDTGINPEHPSFADDGTYGPAPDGWTGTGCDFGNTAFNPDDAAFTCNNKLLAAKHYSATAEAVAGIASHDFLSARDYDGHGSHTASTAAGNYGVAASVERGGETLQLGDIAGIAPRARLSIYKVCWDFADGGAGCYSSDSAAAIDDAVADGVNVINFSISSGTSLVNAEDIAFLFAADAGVAVASSAGNEGPGDYTANGKGPWVTSVGASTHDTTYIGTVTLGDGQVFEGASITDATANLPLIDSVDAGLPGADPTEVELCYPGTLDPSVVAGNIVLCKRGVIARVDKSLAVYIAGGAGMVMYNPSLNSLNADLHYVPSIHVDTPSGLAIKQYIADNGASSTAQLSKGVKTKVTGRVMAPFSSRGPLLQTQDYISPDVTAPGVDVLAATSQGGDEFEFLSGTSMATPHVAGLLALVKQANPDFSASMLKSALMTTARQDVTKEDGVTPADPFDMGAGHVDARGADKGSFLQPGLAYDAGFYDWLAFLCGAEPTAVSASTCNFLASNGYSLDASDFNSPSIAVGELVGSQTVTRTVTSVAQEHGWRTYKVHVDAPVGFDVSVSPSQFRIKSGETMTYQVTITNDGSAGIGEWAYGSLTWVDITGRHHDKRGGHFDNFGWGWGDDDSHYSVYSPIAVRAFEIDAPGELAFSSTDGSASFDVKFGYAGDYTAAAHGLVAAYTETATVVDDPANDINTALSTDVGVNYHFISVSDAVYARFSLFDAYTDGTDDLDLYVFYQDGSFVGSSGSGTSAEQVDVFLPASGTYIVVVHGWQTDGPDATYTLFSWGVPAAEGGSLSVDSAPASATVGAYGTVDISWTGLATGTKYLGAVTHSSAGELKALTLVSVQTD